MLTTKKFIKEVEKLGFEVGQGINIILIYYGNDEIAYIYRNKKFHVGTYSEFSECLSEELQEKLYNLIDEYARTPHDERETQQKFYLKFKIGLDDDFKYLNYDKGIDKLILDSIFEMSNVQTRFTDKERNELKEKFNVALSDFEQIPVDEYWEEV